MTDTRLPDASEETGKEFLDWFKATFSRDYGAPAPLSHPALRIAEARYAGVAPATVIPKAETKTRADAMVDAEYRKEAQFDNGSTYSPESFPTQFLAAKIEAFEREDIKAELSGIAADLEELRADTAFKLRAIQDRLDNAMEWIAP